MKELEYLANAIGESLSKDYIGEDHTSVSKAVTNAAETISEAARRFGFGDASLGGRGALELTSEKLFEGMDNIATAIDNLAEAIREGQQ